VYAEGLTLKVLAELDVVAERFEQATERYRQARERFEASREPEHPRTLAVIEALVGVCRQLGRDGEADRLDTELAARWKLYPFAGDRDRAIRSRSRSYGACWYSEGVDLILHPLPDRARFVEAMGSPMFSAVCHLARWYRVRGWYDMAEEVYRHVLEDHLLDREHPLRIEALEGLCALLDEAGRNEEAARLAVKVRVSGRRRWFMHEAIRTGDPESCARAWLQHSRDLGSYSAPEDALRSAQRALELEPSRIETRRDAYWEITTLLLRLERREQAEEAGRHMMSCEPEGAEHYLFAQVLEARELPVESARHYLEADRLFKGNYPMWRLAQLFAKYPLLAREIPELEDRLAPQRGAITFFGAAPPNI
jgi:tetratricopeptide (TPR) repeat protein